jgi:hypothetical protein
MNSFALSIMFYRERKSIHSFKTIERDSYSFPCSNLIAGDLRET